MWAAEVALLGRLLYKFRNSMGRRFRAYQAMRRVFDLAIKTGGDPAKEARFLHDISQPRMVDNTEPLGGCILNATEEIRKLLPLGHNLPFLLSGLAIMARLFSLLGREVIPANFGAGRMAGLKSTDTKTHQATPGPGHFDDDDMGEPI